MAASLRTGTGPIIRWLFSRNGIQPFYQTCAFCKVPPEDSSQPGEVEASSAEKKLGDEASTAVTQVMKSGVGEQVASHQIQVPSSPENNEKLAVEDMDQVPMEKPASVVEETAQETKERIMTKEEIAINKKVLTQKKLRNLLTSLTKTEPLLVDPVVNLTRPKPRPKRQAKAEDDVAPPLSDPVIEPELVSATKEVAESLGGDVSATESELLSTLRLHSSEAPPDDQVPASLSDLFVGMKIERSQGQEESHVPKQHKRFDPEVDPRRQPDGHTRFRRHSQMYPGRPVPRTIQRVDLFGAEPLGIFSGESSKGEDESTTLPVWEALHKEQLQQSVSHPPENAFVEMAQWTNQGKLWKFPIDNEYGLESEKSVGFQEHVFLEHHLEGWCPRLGPIRHFMELVCTGLSKNPYLTVQRKRAHIEWYRNYFAEKEDLLKEIGAIKASN